ncbi:MAG: hypothetical protein HY459_01995 [Parcubacteria group bacterium]|nr:hypothetical protein [Parcubacteria group bacterium]
MQRFICQTGEVSIFRGSASDRLCFSDILTPNDFSSELLGTLYFVAEIIHPLPEAEKLMATMWNTLTDVYNELAIHHQEPGQAFEEIVRRANEAAHHFIAITSHPRIPQIHALAALLRGEQLYLAYGGEAHAAMIRKGALTMITETPERGGSTRVFTTLVSGSVRPDDFLLFATPAFSDLVPFGYLRSVALETDMDRAATLVSESLEHQGVTTPLAALLVRIDYLPAETTAASARRLRSSSFPTETATQEEEPSVEVEKEETRTPRATQIRPRTALGLLLWLAASLGRKLKALWIRIVILAKVAWLPNLADTLRRRRVATFSQSESLSLPLANAPAIAIRSAPPRTRTLKEYMPLAIPLGGLKAVRSKLTPRRLLLVGSALFIIMAVGALVTRSRRPAPVTSVNPAVIEQMTKLIENAEAKLIIGDRPQAYALFGEAQALLPPEASLKTASTELITLAERVSEGIDRAERTIRLAPPAPSADAAALALARSFDRFVKAGSTFYIIDTRRLALLRYDPTRDSVDEIAATSEFDSPVRAVASPGLDSLVTLLLENGTLVDVKLTERSFVALPSEVRETEAKPIDMVAFGNRIYLLDPESDSILRLNRTLGGYSRGQTWLTSAVDLENARAMAIDGAVYILRRDGSIEKFFQGKRDTSFRVRDLARPLTNPNRLVTSEDLDHLYVSVPNEGRVVVLAKDGALVRQYVSGLFKTLKDFAVTPDESLMLVLAQNRVYEIPLTQ